MRAEDFRKYRWGEMTYEIEEKSPDRDVILQLEVN